MIIPDEQIRLDMNPTVQQATNRMPPKTMPFSPPINPKRNVSGPNTHSPIIPLRTANTQDLGLSLGINGFLFFIQSNARLTGCKARQRFAIEVERLVR